MKITVAAVSPILVHCVPKTTLLWLAIGLTLTYTNQF